jgi:hypothetical protein
MPLPRWFDQRESKQHGPGPITEPRRLVVSQRGCERLLAEQERREVHVECEGSVESLFAQFITKLMEDGGKLGVHFLSISSVNFGRSFALGDARGCRSLEKKSGLGDKLVSIVKQDMSQSSQLFGHYLLIVGIRLFVENSECIMNNGISLEKERGFWDSPCNDRSSEIVDVIGG